MKRKVMIASTNSVYINAFSELFAEETDFDAIIKFEPGKDNYKDIDLIIIDDNLPLIKEIRNAGFKRAILVLLGIRDENLYFQSLDDGASDVMIKPISFEALLIRIRSAIYTEENTFDGMITINNFIFMPKARLLRYIDKEIRLTEKEAGIINLLHKAKPAAVDRLTILKEIWGYNADISTHTLETHIYHLRQKIESVTDEKLIMTLDDGYAITPCP